MPILQDYFEKTCGKWLAPSEESTNFRSVIFFFFIGTTATLSLFRNSKITLQIAMLIASFLNEIINKKI